ncbi:hypothetical protein ACIQGZ_02600 [Streptomyces sp. NPDC092296]|uniref:hypothetical protein n=1 Tax=Streptomyces sp. NPDC092296 TaxID=3366012 RepID=UPI00382C5C38
MDAVSQLVTIAAVVLGAVTTYVTNHLMERTKHRQTLLMRWDEKKLDAYAEYVGRVRRCIYAAVLLFEVREGIRTIERSEHELVLELAEAEGRRALAFERVMMLAGDQVIEAAHAVNKAALAIDWRARGAVEGSLEGWRALHTDVFAAINRFHQQARADLGVTGGFAGEEHTSRGLILPTARVEETPEAD